MISNILHSAPKFQTQRYFKTSGRLDLNQRPLPPQGSALANCATPRLIAKLPTAESINVNCSNTYYFFKSFKICLSSSLISFKNLESGRCSKSKFKSICKSVSFFRLSPIKYFLTPAIA